MNQPAPFRTCPRCKTVWETRQQFLDDPNLILVSYRPDFHELQQGQFLFSHIEATCQASLNVQTSQFLDLFRGKRFTEKKTLGPDCPELCSQKNNFSRCNAECEYRIVREVMHIVRQRRAA